MRIWRDLKKKQQRKYRGLPPVTLFEALKLNLRYADESELARAGWFWLRRPKTVLTKSLLRTLIYVSVAPFLFRTKSGRLSERPRFRSGSIF
jgi:hypothetical protein